MELLGTGSNMQRDSYFRGYYPTRDLNEDASGSKWPLYNDDKILKTGHYYNGSSFSPAPNQNLGYSKQVLKQTMLKHEAEFKDQILELHRLYRRQRELMDETKKKELYKHCLPLEASQSHPVLSQISPEYGQKIWHITGFPGLNPVCSQSSGLGAKDIQSPLSFNEAKSMQAGPGPAQTVGSLKNCELVESRCKRVGKRALDLQLPAYEYIDSEEGESFEDEKVPEVPDVATVPVNSVSEVASRVEIKSIHGGGELNSASQGAELPRSSFSRKAKTIADLNEPIKLEEEETPGSDDFLGIVTGNRKILCGNLLGKTNSGLQISCEEIVHNMQTRRVFEGCSSVLQPGKEERQSRSSLSSSPKGSSTEKLYTSSESPHVELKEAHEFPAFHLLDQSNRKSWSEKAISGSENSRRNPDTSNSSHPGPVGTSDMHIYQLVPRAEVAIPESSMVSSWRKSIRDIRRHPIAVQALPCFTNSIQFSKNSKTSKTNHNSDSVSAVQSGLYHEPAKCYNDTDLASDDPTKCIKSPDSLDVKSGKTIDLNFMPASCSSNVDSMDGLPWLRKRSVCNGKPDKGMENSTQMKSGRAYSPCIYDVELKKVEASKHPSIEKIPGFPMNDRPYISSDQCSHASSSNSPRNLSEDKYAENNEKDGVIDMNLPCDSGPDLGKRLTANDLAAEIGLDKKHSDFKVQFDLNSCINEDESSSTPSLLTQIDLEAPVSPENKECSPPRGESDEVQLEIPSQLSEQEDGDLQEELVRIASEALVSISSYGVRTGIVSAACKPSAAFSNDSLCWFASIVTSVASDRENQFEVFSTKKDGSDHEVSRNEDMDYFEVMTLKLKETEVEEYWCTSNAQKRETDNTSLPCQPRKGRTRRARQRKDFQSEVLPSIASLSRYEVTEDLQTIGGLMEAAGACRGTSWVRNASRKGCSRGTRRSCVSASKGTESVASFLSKHQTGNGELGYEGRSMIDWGKITRRRRGQRCPATNPQLILAQV